MVTTRPAAKFARSGRRPSGGRQKPRRGRDQRRVQRALKKIPALTGYLAQVKDHRSRQGLRHELASMLALLVAGMLCQQHGYRAASHWARASSRAFKRRLGFVEHDTPAPSTFCETLKELDWSAFEAQVRAWATALLAALGRDPAHALTAVSLDGKRLRGSAAAGADIAHVLAAVTHRLALTLGQHAVKQGEGELTVTESFLEEVLFAGCVLTADAQFTQRDVSEKVLAQGADYVFIVKENQPTLRERAAELLGPAGVPRDQRRTALEHENGRSRSAQRQLVAATVEPGEVDWPGVRQVFWIWRSYYHHRTRKHTEQLVYGITSLPPEKAGAATLLQLVRGHWMIETGAFWVRDVLLREDASRVAHGKVAMAMAVCRGLAITLLKTAGYSGVAEGQRAMSANKNRALRLIGA